METLFTISLIELFIGGGGRLIEVGPLTLRMILFAAFLYCGLIVVTFRLHKDDGVTLATMLVFLYFLVHVNALLIGAVKGNDLNIMMGEMQPTLYWLAAPFLALVLRSRDMVLRAAMLVRGAGIILSLGYIGVVLGLALGIIDYLPLYHTLNATGEFMFRTESFFFYKGFLYLCIATIFFMAISKRFSVVCVILIATALVMTLTRGFVLATSFGILLLLIVQRRWRFVFVALALVGSVCFYIFLYIPSQDEDFAASRAQSNYTRLKDIAYVADNFNPGSLLLGQGFGSLINGRHNIENTFIWVFWKLGLVGVLFWLLPLALCLNYFVRINRRNPDFHLACAYLISTVVVYVQTMANPYLNNPIGLSFVLVAIFSLRTLAKCPSAPVYSSYAKFTPLLVTTDARLLS